MIDEILMDLALPGPEAAALLRRFWQDLIRFNRAQNLLSRRDAERRAALLIGESCLAASQQNINENEYVMDLGAGAGIPGIPTSICRRDVRLLLVERRRSRCEFLRREIRALGLESVEVAERDAAEVGSWSGRLDRVLLKAVAPPAQALALARPYLRGGGRAVLYREATWDPTEVLGDWRLDRHQMSSAGWMERPLGTFEFIPC